MAEPKPSNNVPLKKLQQSPPQHNSSHSSTERCWDNITAEQIKSMKEITKKSHPAKVRFEENEADFELTSCGIGRWRPPWLQGMATPFFFMLNLGLVGVIQGMTGTIFFSSISTLERRFGFDSKVSGVIMIADNFADMLLNPIVGYLGVRFNRARLIGFGELILAFASLLTASPYFLYGPMSTTQSLNSLANMTTSVPLCPADNSADCAQHTSATVWPAVVILVLGSWFRGMGYTCYYVVGLPYLDDNMKKEQSPLYISMLQAIRLFGPACGFILSSFCLSFYENPLVDPGFGRNDPRYVGAWWLSFVVVAVLLFLAALPMFLFPFQFRNATVKAEDIQHKMKERGGSKGALKRFVSNPLVLLFVLGNIFRYIGYGGYVMFKSKYIESQFRRSSSSASFITGTTSFLPMAIGILLGGSVISVFKLRPRTVFILVFLVEGISFFTVGSGLFLGCGSINIDGHPTGSGGFALDSSCNRHCDCTTEAYTPVCAPDSQTTYFSPCHAGCTNFNRLTSTFEQCSCFSGSATKGYCTSDVTKCTNLAKYVSVVAAGNFMSSFAKTPNSLIYLRSVDPIDKGFAIGLASTLMDLFAFVPYPLVFGYIADSACLIWESKCGQTGNCWVYDHDKFRNYLHGTAIAFFAIGSCFDFAMIFFAGRLKNLYDEESDNGSVDRANSIEKLDPTTLTAYKSDPISGDQKFLYIDELSN